MKCLRCLGSVLVLWALVSVGCSPPPVDCCANEVSAAAVSEQSIYQLTHGFLDQRGVERKLIDFRGAPVLIAMIFTNCSYACPAIIADVKRLMARPEVPADLQVVFVSMDHERDLPDVLAAFAQDHALAADRYTLLHGDADAVAETAAVLGVRYAKVEGGQFSHSNLLSLLDRDGRVHFRLEGLGVDPGPLLAACSELPSR